MKINVQFPTIVLLALHAVSWAESIVYLDFYEDVGVGVGEGDVSHGLERLPDLLGRGHIDPHGRPSQRRPGVHPTCTQIIKQPIRKPAADTCIPSRANMYDTNKKGHRQHVQCLSSIMYQGCIWMGVCCVLPINNNYLMFVFISFLLLSLPIS